MHSHFSISIISRLLANTHFFSFFYGQHEYYGHNHFHIQQWGLKISNNGGWRYSDNESIQPLVMVNNGPTIFQTLHREDELFMSTLRTINSLCRYIEYCMVWLHRWVRICYFAIFTSLFPKILLFLDMFTGDKFNH
mgnify:CR=1 FL=1